MRGECARVFWVQGLIAEAQAVVDYVIDFAQFAKAMADIAETAAVRSLVALAEAGGLNVAETLLDGAKPEEAQHG